jgi:hypothetical protein
VSFPATITITIASGQDRILDRIENSGAAYGSEYRYSDAYEACSLKIRHSVDSVDQDGIKMARHNAFFERVVYPTPTDAMKKFSFTATVRHGVYNDPAAAATAADGVCDWLITSTNLANLSKGIN